MHEVNYKVIERHWEDLSKLKDVLYLLIGRNNMIHSIILTSLYKGNAFPIKVPLSYF